MVTSNWKQLLHSTRRFLARVWLRFYPKVKIIGVTGSYGKTSTTRAIATVLSEKLKTLQTDVSLDTVYNLPITILRLRPGVGALVLEYGVDHVNEMDFHLSLVKPEIGVITGISPVHSDPGLLGSVEGIIREKRKLIEGLPQDGWAILNQDDEQVRKMAGKTKAKVVWYGTSPKANYWAGDIKVDFTGTSFILHTNYLGQKKEKLSLKIGLVGEHFAHSVLVAFAVGKILGLVDEEIIKGLKKIKSMPGRMSVEKGPKGTVLLDDHLRANPTSTVAGLKTLSSLPRRGPGRGRRVAVLGEMGELGNSTKSAHQKIGKKVAEGKIDFLVSVGPLQKLTAEEAINSGMGKDRVFAVKDVFEAAKVLEKVLKKGDIIYLKGSLLRHLERVVFLLEGKRVDCSLVSCHNYSQCDSCPKLRLGS